MPMTSSWPELADPTSNLRQHQAKTRSTSFRNTSYLRLSKPHPSTAGMRFRKSNTNQTLTSNVNYHRPRLDSTIFKSVEEKTKSRQIDKDGGSISSKIVKLTDLHLNFHHKSELQSLAAELRELLHTSTFVLNEQGIREGVTFDRREIGHQLASRFRSNHTSSLL